ncbi:hypothetical protein HYX13_02045, partial [Candidatus Woesearchaeota archaeon]|nr:hypothetical protein [Candidatus Woesearchaeota archaeon]
MAYNLFSLTHPGAEQTAQQEVKELLNEKSNGSLSCIEFSIKKKEEILKYLTRAQTARRILFALGKFATPDEITLPALPEFSWKEIFSTGNTYSIEFEHLKEAELRQTLARKIGTQLTSAIKKSCNYTPEFTFKKPDRVIVLHFTGKEYVLGIDLAGELQKRAHRIFTHHASFTGDIGYYLVRKSRLIAGDKLLIGWVKDGTLAIEAALFANSLPVHKEPFACQKFPLFQGVSLNLTSYNPTPTPLATLPLTPTTIFAFD